MADENKIPKPKRGYYDFEASIKGVIRAYGEKPAPAIERLTIAKAKREERKDRMEAGEDIAAQSVFRAWENIVLIFRERMLHVGNNVQSKAGLTELQRKAIDQEVSDALRELMKKMVYASEAETDQENVERLK